VRGLVHVISHTAEPAALAEYGVLWDDKGRRFTLAWRGAGVAEVFEVCDGVPVRVADRDAAGRLTNTRLYVERARLPAPEDDEFYLADLIGLAAVDAGGETIGRVAVVHDYGAGASLEIAREGAPRIVPFTRAAVPEVDVAGGRVVVSLPDEVEAGEAGEGREATPPPLEGGGRGEGSLPVSHRTILPRDPSPQPPPTRGGGEVQQCAPATDLRQ
jgi:16S rRNA processing protein RimM